LWKKLGFSTGPLFSTEVSTDKGEGYPQLIHKHIHKNKQKYKKLNIFLFIQMSF